MKYFIVLAAIVSVVHVSSSSIEYTAEQKANAEENTKKCIAEGGVDDPELVKKLNAGDFSDNSEKIQCFTKCLLDKAGILNAAGELQETVTIEILTLGSDKATAETAYAACKNENGANACETAHKIYQCFNKYYK